MRVYLQIIWKCLNFFFYFGNRPGNKPYAAAIVRVFFVNTWIQIISEMEAGQY